MTVADRHGLAVVEDCAHAIETLYHGRAAGTFGEFGCFSFYATKNITTGEGGMVLCRDAAAAARLKTMALHGMTHDAWHRFGDTGYRHYSVVEAGFKYNMMDLQAAIGLHQLERVARNWEKRGVVWQRYMTELADLPVDLPQPPAPETRHARHLFTVLVDETVAGISRDRFLEAMTAHNIGVGVHYRSLAEHPCYQERFGWQPEQWPEAMRIGRQTVSIPLSAGLTDADVDDVVAAVRTVLTGFANR